MVRYTTGLSTMDTMDAATRMFVASPVSTPSSRPMDARMNENSPICASAMPAVNAVRKGYRMIQTNNNATNGLASKTTASAPNTRPGERRSAAGSSNMPTDTKNNTANASRMGNASD